METDPRLDLIEKLMKLREEAQSYFENQNKSFQENSCCESNCIVCNDEKLIFKKQIDETVFFVIDAHHGYNVFQYKDEDKDAIKCFKGWFPSKEDAIEACVKLYS